MRGAFLFWRPPISPGKSKSWMWRRFREAPVRSCVRKFSTNGILYNDMAFSLSDLEEDVFPYLPLFCKFISGTGLPGVPYDRVATELALKTGGFGVSVEAAHKVGDLPLDKPRELSLSAAEDAGSPEP